MLEFVANRFLRDVALIKYMCFYAIAPAIALLSSASQAQTQMRHQIGAPFKPVENKIEKDGLAVMLVSVDDMPGLVAQWYQTAHTPRIKTVATARNQQAITSLVFLTGCKADKNKKCDMTIQYAIKMGTGKLTKIPPQALFRSPPPAAGVLVMGSAMLNTVVEKTDPRGTWVVEADITDNVAKKTVHVKTRFEVLP